jgi:hypothetical protein
MFTITWVFKWSRRIGKEWMQLLFYGSESTVDKRRVFYILLPSWFEQLAEKKIFTIKKQDFTHFQHHDVNKKGLMRGLEF